MDRTIGLADARLQPTRNHSTVKGDGSMNATCCGRRQRCGLAHTRSSICGRLPSASVLHRSSPAISRRHPAGAHRSGACHLGHPRCTFGKSRIRLTSRGQSAALSHMTKRDAIRALNEEVATSATASRVARQPSPGGNRPNLAPDQMPGPMQCMLLVPATHEGHLAPRSGRFPFTCGRPMSCVPSVPRSPL